MPDLLQGGVYRSSPSYKYKVETMQRHVPLVKYSLIKRIAFAALLLIPALGACDDQAAQQNREASSAPKSQTFSTADRGWIDVKDNISPAVWLASREAGRDVAPNDPAAASFRGLLQEADDRFSEGQRMIANRAVQVEAMLAERGVKETPRQVIEGLVSIGHLGERAGFGETCQHYVIARTSSASRVAALDALSRRPLPEASGTEEP